MWLSHRVRVHWLPGTVMHSKSSVAISDCIMYRTARYNDEWSLSPLDITGMEWNHLNLWRCTSLMVVCDCHTIGFSGTQNGLCTNSEWCAWFYMYHMYIGSDMKFDGILPKGPYPPCLRMADSALLAGYHRIVPWRCWALRFQLTRIYPHHDIQSPPNFWITLNRWCIHQGFMMDKKWKKIQARTSTYLGWTYSRICPLVFLLFGNNYSECNSYHTVLNTIEGI